MYPSVCLFVGLCLFAASTLSEFIVPVPADCTACDLSTYLEGVESEAYRLELPPNTYEWTIPTPGYSAPVTIEGKGAHPTDVKIINCLGSSIQANLTLINVWFQGPCTGVLFDIDVGFNLSLHNVHLQNEQGGGVEMNQGCSLLTDNLVVARLFGTAVSLHEGAEWISNGDVWIEDVYSPDQNKGAIDMSYDTQWTSNGPVYLINAKARAVMLTDSSSWMSYDKVFFKNGNTAVWLEQSSWEHHDLVMFFNNSEVNSDPLGCMFESQWYSKGEVQFIENTFTTGAFFHLKDSRVSFLFTTYLQQTNVPFVNCTNATVIAAFDCPECPCNIETIPTVEWQPNPVHLVVHDKKGKKRAVFYEAGDQPFFLHFNSPPANTFQLGATITGLPMEAETLISLKETSVQVEPNQQPEFVLSITDIPSSASSFYLLLQPSLDRAAPSYALNSYNYITEVTVTTPTHLSTAIILFPEGSPDFVFAPTDGNQAEDISATALRAFFLRLVEVDSSAQSVVTSVSLVDMLWESVVDPSSGEIIFSANFTVQEEEEEEEEEGHPVVMQVVFQAVAGGEEVELPNGSLLAFQQDGLKWTLLLQDWPFVHEDNLLELHTILRTGEEQWLNVQEVHNGEGEEEEEREFVLEAEKSRAVLRVLSMAWTEEEFETSKQVGVRVERSEEAEAETEVVFTLPHFQHSLRYDPDVSVLLTGSDGGDGEDGEEEDDEEDEMVLAIVLPVVLGVVVLAAVVVTITVVLVQRKRNQKVIRQGRTITF